MRAGRWPTGWSRRLRVICPWHGYDFHLKTGECGLDPGLRALTYPVKVQDGDLLIEMA